MNPKWKIALIAVFALAVILLVIQSVRINRLQKKNQVQAVELMAANDSARIFKTKSGELYFELNAVTVERNALKNSLEASGFTIKELREMNVKWRDIVSTLKAELAMSGRDTIYLHDTTYVAAGEGTITGKSYNWTNNYLTLSGLIREKFMVTDYKYLTAMSFITEKKGKTTKVIATLADPKARITTGSQIVIEHKTWWYEKPWLWGLAGIGLGVFLGK